MNGFQTHKASVGKDWKARSLSSGQQRVVPPALNATAEMSHEEVRPGSWQTAPSTELCQGGQDPNSGCSHVSPPAPPPQTMQGCRKRVTLNKKGTTQ